MAKYNTALVWLRRDLRLTDHAALYHASQNATRIVLVFVFDREILATLPAQDRRVAFIWASLATLKQQLEILGSSLVVRYGQASAIIPQLAIEFNAAAVYCNRDYEPQALHRDALVAEQLRTSGRYWHSYKDQVIFECQEVLNQTGKPYRVFTPYKNAWLKQLTALHLQPYIIREHVYARLPAQRMPSLAELGFKSAHAPDLNVAPGENGALQSWADFITRIERYRDTRDFPALQGTSGLSVHLRFGTLSIRKLACYAYYHDSAGAQTWLTELIWREFYQQVLCHHPQLAQGHTYQTELNDLVWPNPAGHFDAWCQARTGYPIIDAALRQLNQTGYMHNRLRMISASFLVKDLHVDWRWGEAYFASRLLDFDFAANNGGWQWSASTGCDAQPWFRIFNPITQSAKFDPDGKFIKRYLPELAAIPASHIHAPWQLGAAQQQACQVRIGLDYPAPLVDHAAARAVTLALFKAHRKADLGLPDRA